MTHETETLLTDALRDYTSDIPIDPTARAAIAARLPAGHAAGRWRGAGSRARLYGALAAAAAVVLVAAGVGVLVSHNGAAEQSGGAHTYEPYLPGDPLPPTRFVVATAGSGQHQHDVVLDATTGRIVAKLPDAGSRALIEPQLAPGGTRAYGVWGNGTRLGYLNLVTGKRTQVVHRRGEMDSPTLSADGTTLAYEWTPTLDGNDVASIVVRNLRTGHERVLAGAPAGPTAIPLALSPDGSRLALVPTDGSPDERRVWIVSSRRAQPFAHHVQIAEPTCNSVLVDEPRWTTRGLYAVAHCRNVGPGPDARIVTIDVIRHRVTASQPVPHAGTFLQLAVVVRPHGALFVTADIDEPDAVTVQVRDSGRAHLLRVIHGLSGLAVN